MECSDDEAVEEHAVCVVKLFDDLGTVIVGLYCLYGRRAAAVAGGTEGFLAREGCDRAALLLNAVLLVLPLLAEFAGDFRFVPDNAYALASALSRS